ncbi:MAG: helix-turn-helix transcriptional regulator [Bacteriovoracaceae bacterium]|nr:helix-turn-helix transcriptional regulator [Bacteriovoracaceae bacterium]
MVYKTDHKLLRKERFFIGILLGVVGILTVIDVYEDFVDGTELRHLGLDLTIGLCAISAVVYLIYKMTMDQKKINFLIKQKDILSEIVKSHENKSRIFVEGLSKQIDEEFENWKLSQAEQEVALLLLKGITNNEIAQIRSSADKTIRHQSASIYKKANLKGRQELQAYFLEDLLAPQTTRHE